MRFTDRLILDGGLRRTQQGFAVAMAKVARGGNVQLYRGAELGKPDMDVIRVYRPADEVFKVDALRSYSGVPITFHHPPAQVDAKNWKQYAVGEVGEEIMRDGEFVRVPMMLRDQLAIVAVEQGIRELSPGYDAKLEFRDGVSPEGDAYDAIMSDFRINHVALCEAARGGKELRIGDDANNWGASPFHVADEEEPGMSGNITLRSVLLDGLSVSTTDQGAQAIEKLIAERQAARDALKTAEANHAVALTAKDAEHAKVVATKDAELDGLKGKVITDADLDKRVQARADLIGLAKTIAKDVKTEGVSDADIRKAVVTAVIGADAIAGKPEAYIDARFEILAEDAGKVADPFVQVMKDGVKPPANVNDAYAQMLARDANAWQTQQKENV